MGCMRSKWSGTVVHMNSNAPPQDTTRVARAVRKDIERISSVPKIAKATGIPEVTLRRRLTTGDFKASELMRIAAATRTDPTTYFAH